MGKISVVIPVYNEKNTILEILRRVVNIDLPLEKEIIIVDDCSTDGTKELLENLLRQPNGQNLQIIFSEKNEGKGAAVKKGFLATSGDFIIVQDADLEYDPQDYKKIFAPLLSGRADVVFGSRFFGDGPKSVLLIWHLLGNNFLTFLSNILTNLALTDMETCYKAFTRLVLDSFKHKLTAKRFGIEPELVARVAQGNWRVFEVGIAYYGRSHAEGKKIGWRDGVAAIWHVIKYNIFI